MRNDLDDLLCQRYPLIFADRRRSTKESCMGWGFSCGDGWFGLIEALCERLQFATDHNHAPQIVAAQVKEKFGELCFYPRTTPFPEQTGMIIFAEAMSAGICDQCGKPGQTLVYNFWHMTRCPEHAPEGAVPRDEFIAEREQARRHKLSALVAQCDKDAPPPADMAAWDAAPPTGKEIL
jgi:hypothetical protein